VEGSQPALAKVGEPAMRIHQRRLAGDRERHRVDREVAAGEVVRDSRRADGREGAGPLVGLGTGRRQIDRRAPDAGRRRAEAVVHPRAGIEPPRERKDRTGLGLDREVDVDPILPQDQITDSATDQEHRQVLGGGSHRGDRRHRLGALAEALGRHVLLRWRHLKGAERRHPYHDLFPGCPVCSTSGARGPSGSGSRSSP
jgi:hypothetical protein